MTTAPTFALPLWGASWMAGSNRGWGALALLMKPFPLRGFARTGRDAAFLRCLHSGVWSRRRQTWPSERPCPRKSNFYLLLPAVAVPGFGLVSTFGTLPLDARILCLPAAGFLASRLTLF